MELPRRLGFWTAVAVVVGNVIGSGLGAGWRLFSAMAVEGLLFRPLARVHPRFGTPHVAIATCTLLSLVFVWSRSFEQLVEAFILGVWPCLALAVAAVVILRRKRPDVARPYPTPGYPLVPFVFVLGTLGVVATALVEHPATTLGGVGLTLLGIPVYLVWRAAGRRPPGPSSAGRLREG